MTANLLGVRLEDGPLGNSRSTTQGDPVRPKVSVFRVSPGGHIDGLPFDYQNSVLSTVLTPKVDLAKAGAAD